MLPITHVYTILFHLIPLLIQILTNNLVGLYMYVLAVSEYVHLWSPVYRICTSQVLLIKPGMPGS